MATRRATSSIHPVAPTTEPVGALRVAPQNNLSIVATQPAPSTTFQCGPAISVADFRSMISADENTYWTDQEIHLFILRVSNFARACFKQLENNAAAHAGAIGKPSGAPRRRASI